MRLIALPLLAALTLFPGAVAAQDVRFTPEQQAMIDSLPPGQRTEVMRQAEVFRANQGGTVGARAPGTAAATTATRTPGSDAGRETEAAGVLQANDTLLIDILFPPRRERANGDEERADALPSQHLLLGRHTVELDRLGKLTMPGITDVQLAGLNESQAELRLMAEPALEGMAVLVTRLPLTQVGREALQPFGYNIFKRPMDAFGFPLGAPRRDVAAPSDYRVGPGDTINVFLYGKDSAEHSLRVTDDGMIQIPTLGPVQVAGMQFSEVRALVERRVRDDTIGTQAAVSMGDLRTIEVLVIGEVKEPGMYTVSSLATVITALYEANGINLVGSLRDIRVLRGDGVAGRFDLYELLLNGNASGDLRLETGDVVFVPATGPRAGVMGEVLRPAWYELSGPTTVGQLLRHSGGHGAEADLRHVQIERRGANGMREYLTVDATNEAGRALRVSAYDVVHVPRLSGVVGDAITLRGHFALTGPRQWEEGMRVSDVLSRRSALKPDPDLDYGLVVRELQTGRGIGIQVFSPRDVLAEPDSPKDPIVGRRDEIYTFAFDDAVARRALMNPLIDRLRRQAMRDDGARVAQVTGAVRAPGFYPLADGMRLADLARAGGGLDESAFGGSAEVTRFDTGDGAMRQIEHIEVDLARVMEGDPAANLLVQSHDVLNIKQIPQWTERGTIELRGEVRFPGVYPIRPGEMLSQVIERAGGLTKYAYPAAAVFTRAQLREREQEQIENMVRRLEADVAAAAGQGGAAGAQAQAMGGSMIAQLRASRAAGRLVIDLPALLKAPGDADDDVLVADGDLLAIPPRPQEVTVLGEVNFPTSHVYERGARRDSYIESSGGMTYRADKGRIYIVRANGAVEAAGGRRGAEVLPGDTIVVPLDAERLPTMVRIMNISQVLYQLAIAAAAWNSLGVL